MTGQHIHHAAALCAATALLASLVVVTTAAPASAKPKCFGKAATIVGTARGEVIKGTKKADVIVARGGHDVIYGRGGNDVVCGNKGNDKLVGGTGHDLMLGQTGRDRLFGGPGRDRLLGGPANDSFNGGTGNDLCAQGSGSGPRVNCERPPVPVPVPVVPPPKVPVVPPPKVLVIAYSDLDGTPGPTGGDILISQLVDANRDGVISPGDSIELDKHPANLAATLFGEWATKGHVVTNVDMADAGTVKVRTGGDDTHSWSRLPHVETYAEFRSGTIFISLLQDGRGLSFPDILELYSGTQSQPVDVSKQSTTNGVDDTFIDVDFYFTP